MILLLLFLLFCSTVGCPMGPTTGDDPGTQSSSDAGPQAPSYPPALTDVVSRIGSTETLDLATWNIENFPQNSLSAETAANVIASLDLDLLGVQEICSIEAFEELLGRLPYHEGVLSNHTYADGTYQKTGFIWRNDLLSATGVQTIFYGSFQAFPRPPLLAQFHRLDEETPKTFWAITLHLKAGGADEERERRISGVEKLYEYTNDLLEAHEDAYVAILGDFNERLDSSDGDAVFGPYLNDEDNYHFLTSGLPQGSFSHIWGHSLIDHIIVSNQFLENNATIEIHVPRLDQELNNYTSLLSDHLPVISVIH